MDLALKFLFSPQGLTDNRRLRRLDRSRFRAPSHGSQTRSTQTREVASGWSYIVTLFSTNTWLDLIKAAQHICSLGPWRIGLGPLLWTSSGMMGPELGLNEITRIALLVGFELLPVNSCGQTVKAAGSECMGNSEAVVRWLCRTAVWEIRLLALDSLGFGSRLPS